MTKSFCVLVLVVFTLNSEILCNQRSLTSQAISTVVEEHFVKKSLSFDVISCGRSSYEQDLVEKVKSSKSESSSTRIKHSVKELSQSAIIICGSTRSILDFNMEVKMEVMMTNKSPLQLNFLVHFRNATTEDLGNISRNSSDISRYQSFLIETKKHFELKRSSAVC